ncbi:MAG TPA: hypothetical protein VFY32_06105 [Solirubrobacteraceae bacterium]|nr:hypothetical protein [Solirubrobacteraceae bacterium]
MVPPDQDISVDPLDEELAERGRALIVAAVAETMAPLALRERIEADKQRVAKRGATAHSRGVLGWLLPVGGLVAAATVALVLVLGGPSAPSVLATASLAAGGPVLPAPEEDPSNTAVLQVSMDGVPFPYWGDSFQWEAVGTRDDKIKDRSAKTVFYDNPKGARAAYTILGGDTIDAPSGARRQTTNGTDLFIAKDHGRRIVTWTRDGHTCVLSAPLAVPEDKLLALASWKGKGGVPF